MERDKLLKPGSKKPYENTFLRRKNSQPRVAKVTHEEIARLAYACYLKEGKPEGRALEHWFNAESMSEANFGYGSDHTEHSFADPASV
jgi:hypothetical protein